MKLSTRLAKLEASPRATRPPERKPYTHEELMNLPVPELLRLHKTELNRPCKPLTEEQRREIEELRKLPPEQLEAMLEQKLAALG